MRFPTRRAVLFLVPLVLAICVMGAVVLDYLVNTMIDDLYRSADLVAEQIFEQMQLELANVGQTPLVALADSAPLRRLLDSTQAFGQGVVSAAIINADDRIIVSAQGENEGRVPSDRRSIEQLKSRVANRLAFMSIRELWTADVYELRRPVFANGQPFATIAIGVTTALIADRLRHALLLVTATGFISILSAWVLLTYFSRRLLVEAADDEAVSYKALAGHADEPPLLEHEQFGALTDKFNELSRRVSSERTELAKCDDLYDIIRSIQDAMIVLDSVGSILFANPRATEILAHDSDKIEGQRLNSILGEEDALVTLIDSTMANGVEAHDVTLQLANNKSFLVTLFKLGRGRIPAGLLVVLRDLQTVNDIQAALDHSNRLARLGALISGIAHQMRSPLHAMNLRLELLRADLDESKCRHVDRLRQEVERIDKSIEALLRFLRPENLETSDFDVNQLMRELGARVRAEKVRLEYHLDPQLPPMRADRSMVAEAFTNLIINAVQAMPTGGVLTIRTRADRGLIEVTIADTGVGIEEDRLARIFDLYYTTKASGTGLGLSLALRAIDLNRGTLTIESRVAQGTVCKVSLPAAADRQLKEARPDAA